MFHVAPTVGTKERVRAARLCTCLLAALLLAPAGVRATAFELVRLDDTDPVLSGRLSTASDWPNGKTVLLLHGTFSHRDTEIIQSLETLLAEAGLSTLAINLSLGVDARDGPFPCDREHRHRDDDAQRELQRWTNWLEELGARDITLLGHSRGAGQAARFAAGADDSRVQELILVAPPLWSAAGTRAAYRERHGEDLDALLAVASAQAGAGGGTQLLPQRVGLHYCDEARVSADSFLSYYSDDPLRDTRAVLAQVDMPVLVVAGSEDSVVPGLADALENSAGNVMVVEIDGADHFFRDLYADELVDYALEFLGL